MASTCFSSLISSTTLTRRYCTRSPGAPTRLTIMSGTSMKAGGFGGGGLGMMLVVAVSKEEEPRRGAAPEDGEQADGHDDELELVLRRSGFRACTTFRFIICH